MRRGLGWYVVIGLYGLAALYYAYRAYEEYGEPLYGMYERHSSDVRERAQYRAAAQQTLEGIRRLPEVPRDGRLRGPTGTRGPGAGA